MKSNPANVAAVKSMSKLFQTPAVKGKVIGFSTAPPVTLINDKRIDVKVGENKSMCNLFKAETFTSAAVSVPW